MKLRFSILSLAAATAMAFTSCDDNDDFKAGQPTDPDSPAVGFSPDTEASYLITSTSDSYEVNLVVTRASSSGELTVPVEVVYAAEGLKIPLSVTFADGESETVLTVGAPDDARQSYRYSFSLTFPENMVDYYSSTSGLAVIESALTIVDTKEANCYFYDFFSITGGYFSQDMIKLSDREYLFPDFFKSGYDVTIVVDPTNNQVSIRSALGEYEADYDDYYIGEPLYPGNGDASVYVTDLYIYYGSYSAYYSGPNGSGIYLNSYAYFSDGSSGYDYIYIEFPE